MVCGYYMCICVKYSICVSVPQARDGRLRLSHNFILNKRPAPPQVKSLVTQPRPNHYALVIYASLGTSPTRWTAPQLTDEPESRPRPAHTLPHHHKSTAPPGRAAEHYGSSAWHALPSGHCSLSMAGLLFVTLLLLADIQQHCPARLRHEWRGVLVMAACIPVFIALFIAASRIFDYFHSCVPSEGSAFVVGLCLCVLPACVGLGRLVTTDRNSTHSRTRTRSHTTPSSEAEATCGIVIGGFCALLGFLRVVPFGERPNKPLKWF